LATKPRVRAIGETGLDFFRTEGKEALKLQQHSFEQHIEIAKENSIAMQIHDREAHEEVVKTLLRVGAPEKRSSTVFPVMLSLLRLPRKTVGTSPLRGISRSRRTSTFEMLLWPVSPGRS